MLKGTDAIIFVADSDPALRQANIESMQNLEQNLAEYQLSLDKIPVILQFNKRDLPNALTPDELNADLNHHEWPWFQAVAVNNEGVWETFRAATRALFESLERTLGGEEKAKAEAKQASSSAAPAKAAQETESAKGEEAPADPRFQPTAPVYDVGGTVDDVVRLSDSLKSWGADETPAPEAKKDEAQVPVAGPAESGEAHDGGTEDRSADEERTLGEAAGVGGDDLPADPAPPVEHAHTDSPLPMAEEPPSGHEDRIPPPRVEVAAAVEPPVPVEHPASQAPRPVQASPEGVVRVPVEIDAGGGVVRLEIALEIRLVPADAPKEAKAESEPVGSLDSEPAYS